MTTQAPPSATGANLSDTQRLHDARVDRQVRLALDLATVRAERDRARDTAALLEADADQKEMLWVEVAQRVEARSNELHAELDTANARADLFHAERDNALAEVAGLSAVIESVRGLHARYFDMDANPFDSGPEPEDVWRFDRDLRALLPPTPADAAAKRLHAASTAPAAGTDTEEGHRG